MATNEKGTKTLNSDEELDNKEEAEVEVNSVEEEPSTDVDTNTDFTQTEEFKTAVSEKVEEVIGKRIAREIEKTSDLKKALQEANNALEKLSEEAKKKEADFNTVSQDINFYKVALEEGLAVEVVKSLKGETYEDLKNSVKLVREVAEENKPEIFQGKVYGSSTITLDTNRMLKNMKM